MPSESDKNSLLVSKRLAELMLSVYSSGSKKSINLLNSTVRSIIRESGVKEVPHEIANTVKVQL